MLRWLLLVVQSIQGLSEWVRYWCLIQTAVRMRNHENVEQVVVGRYICFNTRSDKEGYTNEQNWPHPPSLRPFSFYFSCTKSVWCQNFSRRAGDDTTFVYPFLLDPKLPQWKKLLSWLSVIEVCGAECDNTNMRKLWIMNRAWALFVRLIPFKIPAP